MSPNFINRGFFLFFIIALVSSCSHRSHNLVQDSRREKAPLLDPPLNAQLQNMKTHLSTKSHFAEGAPPEGLEGHEIESTLNVDVLKWIRYFTSTEKNRARFVRFLNRGAKYKETVVEILKDNGLPTELYYLPIIESGYQNHARSIASAVGTWQFIRGTAKRYGLRVDQDVDERRDPIRSTEAAAKYLRDLYTVFDDWYLAMASYNAGEGRVLRGIMKGKSRNFWVLSRNKHLPRETRNYVPKFLAAVMIGENPERFGLSSNNVESAPDAEAVSVPGNLHLKHIARILSFPLEELKKLNPHLVHGMTPPSKSYDVWVPEGSARKVSLAKHELQKRVSRVAPRRSVASQDFYRVRRGDTLSGISRKLGVSVAALRSANRIKHSRIYFGQRLKLPSGHYSMARRHVVRRGQNLTSIAKKFGLSVAYLKKINSLKSNRIFPGQKLITAATKAKVSSRYRVRRGDNLTEIARRVGVSLRHLKLSNNLRGSRIMIGQWLNY